MRTIDTDTHGPLPVLDTWRECRNTKAGWTGVNDKGERVNITYRPEERAFGPARMPPNKDDVVLMRGDAYGGAVEGVVLIEPRRLRSSASPTRSLARPTEASAAVYPVEVDGELFNLMERFGGVKFEVQ